MRYAAQIKNADKMKGNVFDTVIELDEVWHFRN